MDYEYAQVSKRRVSVLSICRRLIIVLHIVFKVCFRLFSMFLFTGIFAMLQFCSSLVSQSSRLHNSSFALLGLPTQSMRLCCTSLLLVQSRLLVYQNEIVQARGYQSTKSVDRAKAYCNQPFCFCIQEERRRAGRPMHNRAGFHLWTVFEAAKTCRKLYQ